MNARALSFIPFLIAIVWPAAMSRASDDDRPKPPAQGVADASQQEATADDIARLIKQLDANQFSTREAATQSLFKLGKSAIAPLTAAATTESLEVSMRAIAILKKHVQQSDQATRLLAKQALAKLAKSDKQAVATAAQEAVQATNTEPASGPGLVGGLQVGGIQIGGDPVQIQFDVLNDPRTRRFSSRNVNGVKQTDVEEDERKTRIVDDPRNGIRITVTEKKDGKEETKNYEAKNADELKEKHPDAFKLYEEYSKSQQPFLNFGDPQERLAAMRRQLMNREQIPVPAMPPGLLGRLGLGQDIVERLDRAGKQLDEATKLIKQRAENGDKSDELSKALKDIEDAKQQLDEARTRLGGGR